MIGGINGRVSGFIFADTISLDWRGQHVNKGDDCRFTCCPWIYGYLLPLQHASLTLCLWEVASSRSKQIPVIRSTAYNQPTYLSTSNHVRIFNITFSFAILYTNNTWKNNLSCKQTFVFNTKFVVTHAKSPAYIEAPQILLPVTYPTKTSEGWFIPNKQKIVYTLVKNETTYSY